jgi:rhodanese-related sulfurtransferase
MQLQFFINNWYLFLALIVVLALLIAPLALQQMYAIKSLAPAECVMLINRQSAVIVDVAEAGEYKTAHLPNAINTPLSTFKQGVAALDKYKARPVVVVGRNSNRTLKAAMTLRRRGFASVNLLAGGLAAWEKESLPLEK